MTHFQVAADQGFDDLVGDALKTSEHKACDALYAACSKGHLPVVKRLLASAGKDVNVPWVSKHTECEHLGLHRGYHNSRGYSRNADVAALYCVVVQLTAGRQNSTAGRSGRWARGRREAVT
jgi:hypothetical protein